MAKQNQAYWLDRQKELDKALERDEQALNQRLLTYYENESQRLTKEIAHYYSEYGKDNVLEYRNMVDGLSDADKKLLYSDINEFVQKYPEYAQYMPVSTSIYQLDRMQGLQASIQLQSAKIAVHEQQTVNSHVAKHAKAYINNTAKAMGYGSSFYSENPDIIKKVVGVKWNNGKDFSALIWDNRNKLSRTLQNDVASAIARGDSYDRISKALQEKFTRVSTNNIKRLVYTEDTFVREQANKEVFQHDFERYVFHSLPDACPDHCRPLDGKKFLFDQSKPGTNYPPMHPWCRCYITPDLPRTPEEIDKWVDDYARKHGDSSTAFARNVLDKVQAHTTGLDDWTGYYDFSDDTGAGERFYAKHMTLTKAEKRKLMQGTQEAWTTYTGQYYKLYNYYLRHEKFAMVQGWSKEDYKNLFRDIYKARDGLEQSTLHEDVTLYRYIDRKDLQAVTGAGSPVVTPGMIYTEPAFVSTSWQQLDSMGSCRIKIYAPKGTHGAYMEPFTSVKGEHEVLLQPNTTFQILDVERDEHGVKSLTVTIVDQTKATRS